MALVDKAFGDIITFTRASGGGRVNSLGQFEWVGNDVPRLTYDPVTLQPLGLLVEEQRTNLLTNSVLAGGTSGVVGSGAVAPTNWTFQAPTPSGEIALVATSLGTPGIRFQATAQRPSIGHGVSVLANTTYVHHARITALTGTLEVGNALWVVAQPVGTTLTYWRNGVPIPMAANVSAGDHIAVVVAVGATAGTFTARFGPGSQSAVTCDCTMTMPMVEQATAPSSYIPTTTAQVTRAADMATVNTLSPWYNATEGVLVGEAIPLAANAVRLGIASLDDTTQSNRIQLRHSGGSGASAIVVVSGGVTAGEFLSPTDSWPIGASRKAALSYKLNAFAFSCNGSAAQTDTSGSVPTVTRLLIGQGPGAAMFNGIIRSITYYPRALTAAELQIITAS